MSDGYEIGGSVTAGEIFAGTWKRDVTVRLRDTCKGCPLVDLFHGSYWPFTLGL